MSAKWHRGAPELTWGTLWVTCDNSPTFDGTGPQNAPEGTVDMNSIDNLREYALTAASVNATTRAVLAGYIDGIEREVADMVPLPVDADGVPIYARDMLDGYGKTIEVVELRYGRSGWLIVSRDGNAYADCAAFTHHHAPTVEDVLREFAEGLGVPVADSYIAASAAKLALRGDE